MLVHGWPLSGPSWADQQEALVDAGCRTIAHVRRGFGDSGKPDSGYDYDTLAADLAGLLDGLDLTDVTLVGFSMGGGEVARHLGTHGDSRVRSAVLAEQALAPEAKAADEALAGCIAAFGRTDFRDDLAKITVPTLVIHGDSDATVPFEVSGKRSAEAIAGSELVVLERAPHGLNVSHRDEFDAALLDFLGH